MSESQRRGKKRKLGCSTRNRNVGDRTYLKGKRGKGNTTEKDHIQTLKKKKTTKKTYVPVCDT